MKFKQMEVTTEQAQKWIDKNYKMQRMLKPMLVDYLARALKNGFWNSDLPQPIMISAKGELLDGQHRCRAILKAGISAVCWVAFDVPESAYPDVDSGMSRLLHDRVLFLPENQKANKDAAAIVTFWWFKNAGYKGRPNSEEALRHFKNHEIAIRWAISEKSHDKGIGRMQAAVALAEMYEHDETKTQSFADTVWHGDMKRPNGIRLREFLLKTSGNDESHKHRGSWSKHVYESCVYMCKKELDGKSSIRVKTGTWGDCKNDK